jgi:hypothetical protein
MFGKKKKPKGITLAEVNTRLRGLLLDSQVNHAHELSVILGCSAMSDEVMEREEEESEKRVEKISYLIPMLYAHSHAMSEGSIEYQKTNLSKEMKDIPDELWLESRKMMEQLSISVLMGSISQLVDMGLLEIPRNKR